MTLRLVLSMTSLAAASIAAVAGGSTRATATLPVEELRAGQSAVVKTVFEGARIDTFSAQIVGVLHGGRTEGDLILARATSERVVKSGVAAGMSGSPVYVDGKLIGALSSGWSFTREPLFGITPIGEMLKTFEVPATGSDGSGGTAGPTGIDIGAPRAAIRFGEFTWDALNPASEPVPRSPAGPPGQESALPAPLRLPLACSGLHPRALEVARELFAPLGLAAMPGGRSGADAPGADAFVPGAAVAVDILRGDLQLAAIGTVTYRDGDRVLIFGHPLFQSGEVRLPMSTATITTIVASDLSSFKLGSTGQPIGVLSQDRRAAMAGRIGGPPRLLPLTVRIQGTAPAPQQFRFQSIEDRALAPQIAALAAFNGLLESGGAGANQTLRWTVRLHRPGAPVLALSDITVGETPSTDLVAAIGAPLRFLFNNPYDRLTLDSLEVSVAVQPGRDQWTLRRAELLDAAVRPGGRVRVRCELERWRGRRETVTLSLALPEEAPDGRYALWVGGGPELSRSEAQRLPGRYRPVSLDDAWRRLAGYRPADRLYATLLARAPEVTAEGRDYPELPTSAVALLTSGQSAVDQPRRGDRAILDEVRQPFDGAVRGEIQLEVEVDSKAP